MGNKLDRFVHVRPLHRPPKTVWCKWAGIIHFQPSAIHLLVPFTAPFFIFQIDGWWSSNSAHVTLLGLRVSSECDHWLNFCRIFKSWRPQRAPFGRNLNLKKKRPIDNRWSLHEKKKKQMTSVGGAYLSCAHSSRDLFEWDKSVKCVVISLLLMAATWNLCACRPMNAI